MSDTQKTQSPGDEAAGYEKSDVNVTKLVIVGLLLTVLVVAFVVVLNEYFISVAEEITYEQQLAPESPVLRDLRARETEQLQSYGVIDSAAGKYRIPVQRAMELMAGEAFQENIR